MIPDQAATMLGEHEAQATFIDYQDQRLHYYWVTATSHYGGSMGGFFSLATALAHPRRICKLILDLLCQE